MMVTLYFNHSFIMLYFSDFSYISVISEYISH